MYVIVKIESPGNNIWCHVLVVSLWALFRQEESEDISISVCLYASKSPYNWLLAFDFISRSCCTAMPRSPVCDFTVKRELIHTSGSVGYYRDTSWCLRIFNLVDTEVSEITYASTFSFFHYEYGGDQTSVTACYVLWPHQVILGPDWILCQWENQTISDILLCDPYCLRLLTGHQSDTDQLYGVCVVNLSNMDKVIKSKLLSYQVRPPRYINLWTGFPVMCIDG